MTSMTTLATPVGDLQLVADQEALIGCWFGDPDDLLDRLRLDTAPRVGADLAELSRGVAAYLEGDLDAIDDLPVRQPGSPFRQACWHAMRQVPAGETASYSTLAEQAGRAAAARAAGGACAGNLIAVVVPCHRVVASSGRLGGYAYGLAAKQWLLAHEQGRSTLL